MHVNWREYRDDDNALRGVLNQEFSTSYKDRVLRHILSLTNCDDFFGAYGFIEKMRQFMFSRNFGMP